MPSIKIETDFKLIICNDHNITGLSAFVFSSYFIYSQNDMQNMGQRVTILTLEVDDLKTSADFYENKSAGR